MRKVFTLSSKFLLFKKLSKPILFLGSDGKTLASKIIFYIKKPEAVRTKNHKILGPQETSKASAGTRHRQCHDGQVQETLLKLAGGKDGRDQSFEAVWKGSERKGEWNLKQISTDGYDLGPLV